MTKYFVMRPQQVHPNCHCCCCYFVLLLLLLLLPMWGAIDGAYKILNVRCVRGIGGGIERFKPWRHSRGLNKKTDHMQNPKKNQKIYTNNNSNNNHNRDRNAQISKQSIIALAINNIFMAKNRQKKTATTGQMSFTLGR